MTRLATTVSTILLLFAGERVVSATPIILIGESVDETLAVLGLADTTDPPGQNPVIVKPDPVTGAYLVDRGCTFCPDPTSYAAPDGEDRFDLKVEPGTFRVFLENFSSSGGDESPAEEGETVEAVVIPVFSSIGHAHLPSQDWVVLINSPCEGGTSPELSGQSQSLAEPSGCPVPSPIPEPGTLLLLVTGYTGLLTAYRGKDRWARITRLETSTRARVRQS
jgi:hypothetical protein